MATLTLTVTYDLQVDAGTDPDAVMDRLKDQPKWGQAIGHITDHIRRATDVGLGYDVGFEYTAAVAADSEDTYRERMRLAIQNWMRCGLVSDPDLSGQWLANMTGVARGPYAPK